MNKLAKIYTGNIAPIAGLVLYLGMITNELTIGFASTSSDGLQISLVLSGIYFITLIVSAFIINGNIKHPKIVELTLLTLLGILIGLCFRTTGSYIETRELTNTFYRDVCSMIGVLVIMFYVFTSND